MDAVEIQAMLIRHQAAVDMLPEAEDESGRWRLLAMVVAPGEDLLAASMQAARERGVSAIARRLERALDEPPAPEQATGRDRQPDLIAA